MTFSGWLELVYTLAAIVTAIAAVAGIWRYVSDRNAARRIRWQKTTVQSILQSQEKLSFEELKTRYRSFAADHMKSKLDATDITDEALRMILVDLCADNVVVQFGADQYALTTYLGQMEKMKDQNADLLTLQETFFQAQLEFLAKQDENIRAMLENQRLLTRSVAPSRSPAEIRGIK